MLIGINMFLLLSIYIKQNVDIYTEIINRQDVEINFTNVARIFIDVIDRINIAGAWEEVYLSIGIIVLNINQVIYSLILDNLNSRTVNDMLQEEKSLILN